MVFKQGLPQPTSDNNLTVHALYERKHPIACLTDVFCDVVILLNQSTKDVNVAYFLIRFSFFQFCPLHPMRTG